MNREKVINGIRLMIASFKENAENNLYDITCEGIDLFNIDEAQQHLDYIKNCLDLQSFLDSEDSDDMALLKDYLSFINGDISRKELEKELNDMQLDNDVIEEILELVFG